MKIKLEAVWYLTVKDEAEAERAKAIIEEQMTLDSAANEPSIDKALGTAGVVTWKPTREHKKKAEIAAANPAN